MARSAALQPSLFGSSAEPELAPLPRFERVPLDDTAWVDLARGFVLGGDTLMVRLLEVVPLRQGARELYDRVVDEPRLSGGCDIYGDGVPDVVGGAARSLSHRYRVHFDRCFVNHYRDGADSVAWHRDRVGRVQHDPLIGVLSLGGPRVFALRPHGGGPSVRFTLHSGDLLVMGGSCQHTWEHCVPKAAAAAPRMSVTLRHGPQGLELGPRRLVRHAEASSTTTGAGAPRTGRPRPAPVAVAADTPLPLV